MRRLYRTAPPGKRWVCRPWRTLPNGRIIYASTYGKRVFCWLEDIPANENPGRG